MKLRPCLLRLFRPLGFAALAGLAGCESIGEGSRLEVLTIEPSTGRTGETPYRVYECFREPVALVGTFTDGTRGNFTSRAQWRSSNPEVIRVSNNDEPLVALISGTFETIERLAYQRGTLIPVAPGSATIIAEYLGREIHFPVEVRTPVLRIAETPVVEKADEVADDQATTVDYFMGVGTFKDLTLLGDLDGREVDASVFGSQDPIFNPSLNPILWRFAEPGNRYVSNQQAASDRFELVDDPSNPGVVLATISPGSGVLTARTVDNNSYTVEASLGGCALTARAQFQVARFAEPPLVLERERHFPSEQLVIGTSQLLRVTANLDTDGDLSSVEATQDVGNQIQLDAEPKDSCATTADETICLNSVFHVRNSPPSLVSTVPGTAGGPGFISACFPDCTDDPEDPSDAPLRSNVISLQAVQATLTGITLCPDFEDAGTQNITEHLGCRQSAASQPAYTFPPIRFQAIGHFNDDSLRQPITRFMSWFARPEGGGEDDFAEAIALSNGLQTMGRVLYLQNLASPATFDIHVVPLEPFFEFEAPSPAQLTVTPCEPDASRPGSECPVPPPAE